MDGLPIVLNVRGWPCLVVGAGPVGVRKARQLHENGADVAIVSPDMPADLPAGFRQIARPFEPFDLDGIRLAFAATDDPAVNADIVARCHARGILVNRVDAGASDFRALAAWQEGDLLIAASAAGAALSARLRRDLVASLDPRYLTLATIMAEWRPRLVAASRPDLLKWLGSDEAFELARDAGVLRQQLAQRLAADK
jgi:siroheme synthase-like protein